MKEPESPFIVAVDGPAGAGKSSICAQACKEISWVYVNTGAIYRAVGFLTHEKKLDIKETNSICDLATDFANNFHWDAHNRLIFFKDKDLTPHLQSKEAGYTASCIAAIPEVRKRLLSAQKKLANIPAKGILFDGRDIGTVVFPDADLKIFMTASLRQRALRRREQLIKLNQKFYPLEELAQELELRDRQDGERGVAPMIKAHDAILFDTSSLNEKESIEGLITLIRKYIG